MNELKIWLTSFISFIILDFMWFTAFAAEFTKQKLGSLVRLNSSGAIDANLKPAIIVYALMAMAITFFVFSKHAEPESRSMVLVIGRNYVWPI
jgi:uncharacterized membrane protein